MYACMMYWQCKAEGRDVTGQHNVHTTSLICIIYDYRGRRPYVLTTADAGFIAVYGYNCSQECVCVCLYPGCIMVSALI